MSERVTLTFEQRQRVIDVLDEIDRDPDAAAAELIYLRDRAGSPAPAGTTTQDVTDAQIIEAFPRIAEWCIERFVGDSDQANRRKTEVFELLRELLAHRGRSRAPQDEPTRDVTDAESLALSGAIDLAKSLGMTYADDLESLFRKLRSMNVTAGLRPCSSCGLVREFVALLDGDGVTEEWPALRLLVDKAKGFDSNSGRARASRPETPEETP